MKNLVVGIVTLVTALMADRSVWAVGQPVPPSPNFQPVPPAIVVPAEPTVPTAPAAPAAPTVATPSVTLNSAPESCTSCSSGGCDTGCCNSCEDQCGYGAWIVDFDVLFMQYQRNDNLRSDNFFNYDPSIRIALAHENCDGLGLRLRIWDFDQVGSGNFNGISNADINVDTFNFDFEVYQKLQIGCKTTVEFSGGVRYNEFTELVTNANGALVQADFFKGWGLLVGAKATRKILDSSALYASFKTAILMGDHNARNGHGLEFDQVLSQTEIGIGYEWTKCLDCGAILTLRAGFEQWIWTNYVHDNADSDDNTDIGFGGFVLGGSIQF